jgi:uncharacterized OsmC-like protein
MSDEREQQVSLSLIRDYEFKVSFDTIPAAGDLQADEPAPLGGGNGPNASALLSAAVGNCLAASLAFCLRKSRVELTGLDVRVNTQIVRNDAGRFRIGGIRVHLRPGLAAADPARFARCRELFEDFCIVTASVRQGIPIEISVDEPGIPAA